MIDVILYVQDIASQVTFYEGTFRLELLYPSHVDDYSNESWLTLDIGQSILALHAGGHGRIGTAMPKIVWRG